MIASRALFIFAALALPFGSGLAAQEPTPPSATSEVDLAASTPDPVEQAERKKILVMIEQAPNRLRPGTS